LGIPRGGVIIAEILASKLNCEFDLIISRKLRAPHNKELAIGSVMGDGTTYLNTLLIKELEISPEYIENERFHQLEEIRRRTSLFCSGNGTFTEYNKLDFGSKTVILTDDGAATGATIIAAARYIRATMRPHQFIVAIPIAPKSTLNLFKNEHIDYIEAITSPRNSIFKSVEQYYENFNQVTDEQVIDIIYRNIRK
jgi:putative phosphoribosyl transferase